MNIIKLIVSILICFAAAAIGSFATTPSIPTWYAALNKPSFNPPNWIFGPVWTLLYLMMAVAAFLIWQKGWNDPKVRIALMIFLFQLALNSCWSIVFFGWHSLWGAFAVIIFLWLAILATIIKFWPLNPLAGWLLIPYILWVSFASFLNLTVALLNR
ncbi:MAG: tryptophan-rich sensory protein [Candidatus Margulisbacteria bacterium]|nr:tryptophan-rich sensory protein [Candidatus Margulisiibacteriota bacterium]